MPYPLRQRATHRAPLSHPAWQLAPGLVIALAIIGLTVTGVGALLWQAPELNPAELWQSRYLRNVVSFTLWQALLSVVISTLVAIPVARALARQPHFPGRSLLLRLMELSLVMARMNSRFSESRMRLALQVILRCHQQHEQRVLHGSKTAGVICAEFPHVVKQALSHVVGH